MIQKNNQWHPAEEEYFKLEREYRELENRYIHLYNKYCKNPLQKKRKQINIYKFSLNMKEEDYKALKEWLIYHEYYVGNSGVAKSLRKLADEWED